MLFFMRVIFETSPSIITDFGLRLCTRQLQIVTTVAETVFDSGLT